MTPEQFRVWADLLPEPTLLASADGLVRAANAATRARLGVEPAAIVGRRLDELVAEGAESVGAFLHAWARSRVLGDGALTLIISESPLACRCEGALLQPATTKEPAQLLIRLLPIDSTLEYFTALTEKQERALRESEQRFRQLAEHITDVFWLADPRPGGRLLYVSPAYEAMWGRSCQSLYADPESFLQGVVPEDRERVRAAIARQAHGEATVLEYQIVRPDGTTCWIWDRAYPIRDESGQVYRVAGIAEDMTARRQGEEALREADRRKDEFLATLGHELRNPLAPIRNALHVLRQPNVTAEQAAEVLATSERQVQHMGRMLDDLLDVSRISHGRVELQTESIDVATALEHASSVVRPLMAERRHEFIVTLPNRPMRVRADPLRLEQTLVNLLDNAARYTEPGGCVRLSAAREGDHVVFRVRDAGAGIAAEVLPHLFQPFMQAERRVAAGRGGVGIGLALVRQLVELHGGSVEAHSAGRGQGSEFVVRLPAATAQACAATPPAAAPATAAKSRRRVLVIDDNKDAADSLAMILSLQGQEVRTAYGGTAALEIARSFHPEMVFLDLGMPDMNGCEVARYLRALPETRAARLVALTGGGQEEDRRRTRAAGFDAHLVKPIEPDILEQLLAVPPRTDAGG